VTGNVLFRGKAIEGLTGKDAQEAALKIQMIFQDPMSSLNPRLRVQDIIGEAPVVHGVVDSGNITDYVEEIMLRVGLDPSYARRYPHQFSGRTTSKDRYR
jgi:peptide/nickel transport system ATP-binding protein